MSKTCSRCGSEKEIFDFNKKKKSRDGYQAFCKSCSAIKSKSYYDDNKEQNRIRLAKNKKAAQDSAKLYVANILCTKGCIDCGLKDLVVLDFDHMGVKKYNVSRMIHSGYSLVKIIEEIEKCEIRCANCHRRKTANDFAWWRVDA